MPEAKLIGRPVPETPTELTSSAASRYRQLPPDLLRQASRRLEILALVGATLWTLGPGLGHVALYLTDPGDARWAQFGPTDAVAAFGVLVSLALFVFLRMRHRDPAFVIDLALGYMVTTAALIGLMMHWGPPGGEPLNTTPTISWTAAVVLMFAALMPAPPWKMLIAGFVAASMDPISMMVLQGRGIHDFGPGHQVFVMHYPSYLLLGVAIVISRTVTGLGRQVAKEREMGSYRLGELLGRGGMGEVYRATHRMLARPAAIKLIQARVLSGLDRQSAGIAVARFRREAEAAARLQSPHTVALYDFGETEDGTLYFVMELLEGMDLETLVRQDGPLPQKRVIHILRQVCESLAEAHAAGLIHRDIKPANIHIGRFALHHDFAKVLDFGLVKSLSGQLSGDSAATAAGLTPGTPAYLAPEIALGETADARSDLYSLGCVAYFLLTGQLVFDAGSGFQMIAKHIQEAPAPPSGRTELDIASELDQVVLACLAKRPDDRPQSALELDRMLAEIEIEPWSEEDATRWWRSHQPA